MSVSIDAWMLAEWGSKELDDPSCPRCCLLIIFCFFFQVEMVSREITIQVPKVIMEEVEVTYNVPAMETRSHTVQRPKTVM
jgi:hypothetical protein